MIDRHPHAITSLVARAVLDGAMPTLPDGAADRAARRVAAQVEAMPDVTRAGVRVAERATVGALCVAVRGSFSAATPGQRAAVVARVEGLGLPLLGDYLRLVRSLALVAAHEAHEAPA